MRALHPLALIRKGIKIIDTKFLKGKISRYYANYRKEHAEEIYNRNSLRARRKQDGEKLEKVARRELSVRDILLAQYYQNDFSHYMHYDGIVRKMAIEEYYGKNDYGFELYQRMQMASGFDWRPRFRELIRSYDSEGYKDDSVIELDRDLNIMDGSHRLTLALYHSQDFIKADIYNGNRKRSFDIDYFWKNGFSEKECLWIVEETKKLLSELNYPFIGVLWPPAIGLKDEVFHELCSYGGSQIKILEQREIRLERGDFVHLFKAFYHTDILSDKGAEDKIQLIENSMTDEEKKRDYTICVFKLKLEEPQIGINPKNYQTQSLSVKRIKTTFRKRYESRIYNYNYDVMLHISDNYLQSRFCSVLLDQIHDLRDYFYSIKEVEYYAIRARESRQHSQFPRKYYMRSDIDIVVRNSQSARIILDKAYDFSKEHFTDKWIKISKTIDHGAQYLAILLLDFPLFTFEVLEHIYGLDDAFRDECMEHRQGGEYFVLPDGDEVIIRIMELFHKPKKVWYQKYLRNHITELDESRMFLHLNRKEIDIKKFTIFFDDLKKELNKNE